LPNGGYLDIYQDAQGLYTVRQARIIVTNADASTGLIPIGSTNPLTLVNNSLYYNVNVNYVAATNNVKQDSNNAVFNADYLTELIFTKSGSNVKVEFIVNVPNGIVFDHTVTSL
jgi:hypothetical protein